MTLHRLLGFRAAVPDPDALTAYYGELGLTGDATAGFTGSAGGATVQIDEGPVRRLLEVGIGCSQERDVEQVAQTLSSLGATAERVADGVAVVDPASSVRFIVGVADPEPTLAPSEHVMPNAPGAVVRVNERAPTVTEPPRAPRRLGHLVIGTPDLRATRDLLVDGIGFHVSDEFDGIIHFLRCSTDHHNVALVHSPVPILQHYSWECDDIDHVGHAATALYRTDTTRHSWGLGRHFAGSNFYWYLRDPAGSFIELYADLDHIDDQAAWECNRGPFEIEHVANAWGPNLPTEFVIPNDLAELEAAWAKVGP
jgi:hypothetical protein